MFRTNKGNKVSRRNGGNFEFSLLILGLFIALIVFIVLHQLREHYDSSDPKLEELRNILSKVHPGLINAKLYKGNRSYTINKEKIFLCLKDEKGDYYDQNQLVYVTLHEFAHTLSKSIGHNEEFYSIFDQLLERATQLGIYNPNVPPIKNYCEY